MQVLPGHPLAHPKDVISHREEHCKRDTDRHQASSTDSNPGQQLSTNLGVG